MISKAVLATLLVSLLASPACGEEQSPRTPLPEDVQAWVKDLGADRFSTRDAATKNLVAAGVHAIAPLVSGMSEHGLEVTTRGIYVLQQVAVGGDETAEEAARQALEQIASARVTAAARHARDALAKLDALRQQRALEELTRLGAIVNPEHIELAMPLGPVFAIEINKDWKGGLDGLRWLRFLNEVEQISLIGPAVTDDWLTCLADLDSVLVVKIKRTSITDNGLAVLQQMDALQYVKLLYLPIGDPAVQYLAPCRRLVSVQVFGTRMTAEGEAKLRENARVAKIDRRNGAFLGIAPTVADNAAWQILTVTEGSSAERAGLRPGDTIVSYEGKPVGDFGSLTAMISQNDALDTVTVQILRDAQLLERRITLGEWD